MPPSICIYWGMAHWLFSPLSLLPSFHPFRYPTLSMLLPVLPFHLEHSDARLAAILGHAYGQTHHLSERFHTLLPLVGFLTDNESCLGHSPLRPSTQTRSHSPHSLLIPSGSAMESRNSRLIPQTPSPPFLVFQISRQPRQVQLRCLAPVHDFKTIDGRKQLSSAIGTITIAVCTTYTSAFVKCVIM